MQNHIWLDAWYDINYAPNADKYRLGVQHCVDSTLVCCLDFLKQTTILCSLESPEKLCVGRRSPVNLMNGNCLFAHTVRKSGNTNVNYLHVADNLHVYDLSFPLHSKAPK